MNKSVFKSLILVLLPFFVVTGCQFVTKGKESLTHYCPGLKLNISGISYAYSNGKAFYVINYDPSFQQAVKSYFEEKENGFTEIKDADFYNIKMDDEPVIDKSDNFLGKRFKDPKGSTEVIFNETTRRIITIED